MISLSMFVGCWKLVDQIRWREVLFGSFGHWLLATCQSWLCQSRLRNILVLTAFLSAALVWGRLIISLVPVRHIEKVVHDNAWLGTLEILILSWVSTWYRPLRAIYVDFIHQNWRYFLNRSSSWCRSYCGLMVKIQLHEPILFGFIWNHTNFLLRMNMVPLWVLHVENGRRFGTCSQIWQSGLILLSGLRLKVTAKILIFLRLQNLGWRPGGARSYNFSHCTVWVLSFDHASKELICWSAIGKAIFKTFALTQNERVQIQIRDLGIFRLWRKVEIKKLR